MDINGMVNVRVVSVGTIYTNGLKDARLDAHQMMKDCQMATAVYDCERETFGRYKYRVAPFGDDRGQRLVTMYAWRK